MTERFELLQLVDEEWNASPVFTYPGVTGPDSGAHLYLVRDVREAAKVLKRGGAQLTLNAGHNFTRYSNNLFPFLGMLAHTVANQRAAILPRGTHGEKRTREYLIVDAHNAMRALCRACRDYGTWFAPTDNPAPRHCRTINSVFSLDVSASRRDASLFLINQSMTTGQRAAVSGSNYNIQRDDIWAAMVIVYARYINDPDIRRRLLVLLELLQAELGRFSADSSFRKSVEFELSLVAEFMGLADEFAPLTMPGSISMCTTYSPVAQWSSLTGGLVCTHRFAETVNNLWFNIQDRADVR